jgi:sodium-dependent dicarboxylate transporter 2/3/5
MGRVVLALMAWMATWWMTEAIPLPATALLPLVILPVAGGFVDGDAIGLTSIAPSYSNQYIFLFGGGFLLALAMERWGLHRRIALRVLATIGGGPRMVVAAFMGLAALFSMWVSNTATAVMMLPIALSIASRAGATGATGAVEATGGGGRRDGAFARALLLGIAWGCSIGGVGTLIGTPPNALLASFVVQEYGPEATIGFAEWMMVGVPVVLVMLPLAWLLLVRVVEPLPAGGGPGSGGGGGAARVALRSELAALGRIARPEWIVLVVFLAAAAAWITRPLWTGDGSPLAAINDAGIALTAALVLFLVPSGDPRHARVLDWDVARDLPWGILLLFGGGLALAGAITRTGVDDWFGGLAGGLDVLPTVLVVLAVVAVIVFLTEITSNTATTAAALPVLAALAAVLGIAPLMLLAPAAIAASCAFMMPVATPPNAIVFGSGRLAIADMVRAGFLLNLVSIVVVTAAAYGLVAVLLIA